MDQVGLVGVAELVGDGAPARLAAERGLEGGAQPSDPGVLLWREAGRAAQRSLELPDPEPGVAGEARDGEVAAGGDDGAYGAAHDGVERRGVAQAGREPVVEDGRGLDGIRRDGCDRCGHVGRFGAEQLDCRGPGAAERFDRDAEDGGAGVRPEADPGHDDVAGHGDPERAQDRAGDRDARGEAAARGDAEGDAPVRPDVVDERFPGRDRRLEGPVGEHVLRERRRGRELPVAVAGPSGPRVGHSHRAPSRQRVE